LTPSTLAAPVPRIRWLVAPTSPTWLQQANSRPDLLLIDHAHCERKAAGAALQLMFRYPGDVELAEALSPLAREELEHFERVLQLLERRAIPLRPLQAPAYGAELSRAIRRQEPQRMLDSFLVAGLIEARSHERMALLAEQLGDPALRELYGGLLASEARHFGLYWLLCDQRFGREATLARLQELAVVETDLLRGTLSSPELLRMHSVGVSTGVAAGESGSGCQRPAAAASAGASAADAAPSQPG